MLLFCSIICVGVSIHVPIFINVCLLVCARACVSIKSVTFSLCVCSGGSVLVDVSTVSPSVRASVYDTVSHKVRTYKEYHSVCPLSELGLSQSLSRQRVFPSPQKQGGGGTLACGRGVGGSPNSDEGHTLWYSLHVRTLCCVLYVCICRGQ